MSGDIVIRAEELGKKYLIGHQGTERYTALRDVLARAARGLLRSAVDMARGRQLIAGDKIEEFWALKDVSFEVKRGEVIGIIGRNGAGKSTLLKILSRITEPSEGGVQLRGRVASLLEVGTGFHPELTGRENIYLNGAILGMSRAEIRRKFDQIVAFAEVEKFLDTPVKRYSTGMYVRLAFAVAAHLEPEILIVDEVLAVGDAEFQKKCLGRMRDIGSKEGRTVLFVSHNLNAVRSLCTKGLMFNKGRLTNDGDLESVLAAYSAQTRSKVALDISYKYADTVKLCGLDLVNTELSSIESIRIDQKVGIRVQFEILNERYKPDIWISVYTIDGALAFGSCIDRAKGCYGRHPKQIVCWIPPNLLNATSYNLRVTCLDLEKGITFFDLQDALSFDAVENIDERAVAYRGEWRGCLRPKIDWEYVH